MVGLTEVVGSSIRTSRADLPCITGPGATLTCVTWTPKTYEEQAADYLQVALASRSTFLPPRTQKIGASRALWFESEPGVGVILCTGGNIDDRWYAESVVREQLRACGVRQARFHFEPQTDDLRRTADWQDIEAKAKRLIQSGNVTLLRNGYNNVVGHVIGDHGEYQTELSRDDPSSRVITQWTCECPWDQYAFQRTRQWKKYEGRPCAHVLATIWQSQATPLDEDVHPATKVGPLGPGTQLGLSGPGMHQTAPPPGPTPRGPGIPSTPGVQQLGLPMDPGAAIQPSGVPTDPGIIPSMEEPSPEEQIPPASVPGGKPPTPWNPTQFPGGTYSAAEDSFENGATVRLNDSELGVAEGKSEEHGAGQYVEVPKGAVCECLGQDPTTGWVDIAWPLKDSGPMEPYHVRLWVEPSKLTLLADRSTPFVKRRGSESWSYARS